MTTRTVRDLLRRVIGSAFEAGERSASRPPADRQRAKLDVQKYGEDMLAGHIEATLRRLEEGAT